MIIGSATNLHEYYGFDNISNRFLSLDLTSSGGVRKISPLFLNFISSSFVSVNFFNDNFYGNSNQVSILEFYARSLVSIVQQYVNAFVIGEVVIDGICHFHAIRVINIDGNYNDLVRRQ